MMDNSFTHFVVLVMSNHHLWTCLDVCENGAADPGMTPWGGSYSCIANKATHFLFQTLFESLEHGVSTRNDNFSGKFLAESNIKPRDIVVQISLEPIKFVTKETPSVLIKFQSGSTW